MKVLRCAICRDRIIENYTKGRDMKAEMNENLFEESRTSNLYICGMCGNECKLVSDEFPRKCPFGRICQWDYAGGLIWEED